MTDYRVVIENKQIYDFYNTNPNINIENVNLLLIKFIENIINQMSNDVNTNINSQLLSYISSNKTQIDTINNNISSINENLTKMNTEITNNMLIQFVNLKKEYIDDVRQIISNSTLTVNEKMTHLI